MFAWFLHRASTLAMMPRSPLWMPCLMILFWKWPTDYCRDLYYPPLPWIDLAMDPKHCRWNDEMASHLSFPQDQHCQCCSPTQSTDSFYYSTYAPQLTWPKCCSRLQCSLHLIHEETRWHSFEQDHLGHKSMYIYDASFVLLLVPWGFD